MAGKHPQKSHGRGGSESGLMVSGKPNPSVLTEFKSVLDEVSNDFPFVKREVLELDFNGDTAGPMVNWDSDQQKFTMNPIFSNFDLATNDRIVDGWGKDTGTLLGGVDITFKHELGHVVTTTIRKHALATGGLEASGRYHDGVKALRAKLGDPSEYSKTNLGEWTSERYALEATKRAEPVLTNYMKSEASNLGLMGNYTPIRTDYYSKQLVDTLKHMAGKHPQKSHGRGGSSGGGVVTEPVGGYTVIINPQIFDLNEITVYNSPFLYNTKTGELIFTKTEKAQNHLDLMAPLAAHKGLDNSGIIKYSDDSVHGYIKGKTNPRKITFDPEYAAGLDRITWETDKEVAYNNIYKAMDALVKIDGIPASTPVDISAGFKIKPDISTTLKTSFIEALKHMAGKHPQKSHGRGGSESGSRGKVWDGQPMEWDGPKLTKLEVGERGERLAMKVLSELKGVPFSTLNVGVNNAPIDVAGNHTAVEVKAGLATNGKSAQHWRATIGQPGIAERAQIAKMSKPEKKAHHAYKKGKILERKAAMVDSMSEAAGAKINGKTIGVILHPDGTRGDVYLFEGFHSRISWKKAADEGEFLGTHEV